MNQPICDTNPETPQVVLSSPVMSMLVTVVAVERDRCEGGKVDSYGSVVVLSDVTSAYVCDP